MNCIGTLGGLANYHHYIYALFILQKMTASTIIGLYIFEQTQKSFFEDLVYRGRELGLISLTHGGQQAEAAGFHEPCCRKSARFFVVSLGVYSFLQPAQINLTDRIFFE